jgi:amino acid efflux transporter
MALTTRNQHSGPAHLTTSRGAALYIGALLGPGLLLMPGLAAAEAGPASILAWIALLILSGLFAAVFSALGRQNPSAGGVIGYVTAGLGSRAGRATGWMFLAGVVCGAPIVCLIGASYFTYLTGGGQLARAAVAAALLLIVVCLAARGLRASAAVQLILVSVLTGVVVIAAAGSAGSARAASWAPFAPHGWMSIGSAAATLMFSFVGWEAVAPLTTRFANPGRQLARVIAIALAVTTVLYLGLAIATISVLGPRAATDVPLAGLLSHAIGAAGHGVAAVTAIVLTLGATNAYINGAAAMSGQLVRCARGGRAASPVSRLLGAITAAGLLLITLYGLRVVSTAALVAVPTTLFLAVYLGAMVAAARVLRGWSRRAAVPAAVAVVAMLGFCGWAIAMPAAIAVAVGVRARARARAHVTRQGGRCRHLASPSRGASGLVSRERCSLTWSAVREFTGRQARVRVEKGAGSGRLSRRSAALCSPGSARSLGRVDISAHDPRVLAYLPSPREPVLLEQLDCCAEQEPALGFAAGGGLGDRFDQAAARCGDLGECAVEPGSCDPLAAMPLVGEYAGDPPARRRRRVLAVFNAVPERQLVRAAVLAPALRESLLVENERSVRLARQHELLLQGARIADPAAVRRVECDAPAAPVDPVVALD